MSEQFFNEPWLINEDSSDSLCDARFTYYSPKTLDLMVSLIPDCVPLSPGDRSDQVLQLLSALMMMLALNVRVSVRVLMTS